jgi:CRISPR/Cas system Type II protein with McrA/HNH and RuvC-like nuclease domain
MKDYVLKDASQSPAGKDFLTGLVFGFDVGTGSIGYAVREKDKFLDAGVLICPEGTNDLSERNGLRRQRRTLDHRQSRRDWFAENLAKTFGLSLHKGTRLPDTAWTQNEKGNWIPMSSRFANPVSLRVDALAGKPLTAEQLFTALAHLIKHRGPSEKVPWSKTIVEQKRDLDEKDAAGDTIPADQVRAEFEKARNAFVS